jgi:ASC-1-like (ASCH) protein
VPSFSVRTQVYEWIKAGEKTIEIRKGKQRKGEIITFLSGRNQSMKGTILQKCEGKLEDVLNVDTYKKIVPRASNVDDALTFVKDIYPITDGPFTTYEFRLNKE